MHKNDPRRMTIASKSDDRTYTSTRARARVEQRRGAERSSFFTHSAFIEYLKHTTLSPSFLSVSVPRSLATCTHHSLCVSSPSSSTSAYDLRFLRPLALVPSPPLPLFLDSTTTREKSMTRSSMKIRKAAEDRLAKRRPKWALGSAFCRNPAWAGGRYHARVMCSSSSKTHSTSSVGCVAASTDSSQLSSKLSLHPVEA